MAAVLEFPSEQLQLFLLQVSQMFPTEFQVKWPFVSGEKEKNRFSRVRPSWNDFLVFLLYKTP